MKQLFVSILCIGIAYGCNNSGNADGNSTDTTGTVVTPPVNREGGVGTGTDNGAALPADTSSATDSGMNRNGGSSTH